MTATTQHSTCPICGGSGDHDFSSTDLMFNGTDLFHYHRCTACGAVYQHPQPGGETIAGFYPDSYNIYTEPTRTRYTESERAILARKYGYRSLRVSGPAKLVAQLTPWRDIPEVIPYRPDGRALDIGCGNGEYLLRLASIGWNCQGVEFNEKAVSICRAHGLHVFHGDLQSAGLAADSFDLISAHHLIEHVPDPHQLLGEIARITRPGGTIMIRTPNSDALGRAWLRENWFANEVPRHLFLYSRSNLEKLAAAHGLRPTKFTTAVKPKLLLRSLDYRFGNRGVPSEKRKLRKQLAKLYIPLARLSGRGDELYALFTRD